jgi:hypothetical protein
MRSILTQEAKKERKYLVILCTAKFATLYTKSIKMSYNKHSWFKAKLIQYYVKVQA